MFKIIQRDNSYEWCEVYRYTFAIKSPDWKNWRTPRYRSSGYIHESDSIEEALENGYANLIKEVSDGK